MPSVGLSANLFAVLPPPLLLRLERVEQCAHGRCPVASSSSYSKRFQSGTGGYAPTGLASNAKERLIKSFAKTWIW